MAITYVSGSSTTYASRTNTTITAPGSIANGDYLVASVFLGNSTAPSAPTAPAGFTEIGTVISVNDGGFHGALRTYIKKAASESGSYTWTHSTYSSCARIDVYRGVDGATAQDATQTQNSGTAGLTRTWTGLTTATNGAWIIAHAFDWADTTNNLTAPSGMTERSDFVLMYTADEAVPTAGATGNRSHNCNSATGTSPPHPWGARLIALRPASSGAYTLTADAGSYAVAGTAAGLSRGLPLVAAASSFANTATAAGLLYGRKVVADTASYSATGTDVTLTYAAGVGGTLGPFLFLMPTGGAAGAGAYTLTAESAPFAFTPTDAALTRAIPLVAGSASYAATPAAAGLLYGRAVGAGSASFEATPTAAGLLHGYALDAGAAAFAATGTAAGLLYGRSVGAGSGAYAYTATAAGISRGVTLAAGSASFAYTPTDVALTRGLPIVAGSASYAATGTAAGLLRTYLLGAGSGAYAYTPTDVALSYVQVGAYALPAESAPYVATATAAGLLHGYLVGAGSAAYAATGTAAELLQGRVLGAGSAAYAATGSDATLTYTQPNAYTLTAGSAAYAYTATDATLAYGQLQAYVLSADSAPFAFTPTAAGLVWSGEAEVIEPPALGGGGTPTRRGAGYQPKRPPSWRRKKDEEPEVTVVVAEPDGDRTTFEVPAAELRPALPEIAEIMDEVRRDLASRMVLRPNDDDEVVQIMQLLAEMED